MEELLESFATAALGFDLKARITEVSELPPHHRRCSTDTENRYAWAAWRTDRGIVTLWARAEEVQSNRTLGLVVWIEWWIGTSEHHEGWWRVEPKWPRDWIKGHG
jgi:hypothetical protein